MSFYKYFNFKNTGIGVLLISVVSLSVKLINVLNVNANLQEKLVLDSKIHQNQIEEVLKRYDESSHEVNLLKDDSESDAKEQLKPNESNVLSVKENFSKNLGLKILSINIRGVQIFNGDIIETKDLHKLNQFRICFTLENNHKVSFGKKTVEVQIRNPKNRLVKANKEQLVKSFVYDKNRSDICFFVDVRQRDLISGNYEFYLLNDGEIIASTNYKIN